ncbi:lectin subunit alpha-like [Lucilia sericata]|uniref:lectin subunit alpha-like n=1 Tax=Lucilia sericata TaxID=13632 RepID=UPI0018A82D29|nr:lectin subunit alpha-like [Lucilia sericata]
MKCVVVYILFLINLVYCVPEQKWRESEDGSKFYIEPAGKYNWYEAWSDCARKNMSLIAIDTYAKHQQIDNLLKRLYNSCPPVWIAGHDNAVHLRFEWASTGQPFSFTNWGANQPADTTKNEPCILMWTDFQWHDYPCTNKLGYICEEHPLVKNGCNKPLLTNAQDMSDLKNILFYFRNGK